MTHLSTIDIPGHRFIHWMNVIRGTENDELRYSLLECFWESQVTSKYWMKSELENINENLSGVVYVFGGWHGLASMVLVDAFPGIEQVYSIDKNSQVAQQGRTLTNNDPKIFFHTMDMNGFKSYSKHTSLIVNTSTEHINQDVFDGWMAAVPDNVLVVLQGNNYSMLENEHIRTTETLDEFKEKNKLGTVLYSGELDCKQFIRYMQIGYKNEL